MRINFGFRKSRDATGNFDTDINNKGETVKEQGSICGFFLNLKKVRTNI